MGSLFKAKELDVFTHQVKLVDLRAGICASAGEPGTYSPTRDGPGRKGGV